MQRFDKREKLIICAFAVLLCLTLASFWMTSNIYARYATEVTGSDSARVAKFNVTQTDVESYNSLTKEVSLDIAPGESQEYRVQVKNDSEVAIEYVISAQNKFGNLPLEFSVADVTGKSDASGQAAVTASSGISVQTVGTIGANDNSAHTYSLTVSWPKDKTSDANELPDDESYVGKVDVLEITLEARQKD